MGLFDKLSEKFEKKECVFCGKELGLLGKKKLEDGVMCKDCVALLSPWFTDRKNSTVAEIDEQLAYREQNLKELESFNCTCVYGDQQSQFMIDEPGRRFIVLPRKNADVEKINPDIISFDQVTEMKLDMTYNSTEEKMTQDGQRVSYNPPRYEHTFMFYVVVKTSHPYAHEHRCQLNPTSVKVHTAGPKMSRSFRLDALEDLRRFLEYFPPRSMQERYQVDKEMDDCFYFANMGDEICRVITRG